MNYSVLTFLIKFIVLNLLILFFSSMRFSISNLNLGDYILLFEDIEWKKRKYLLSDFFFSKNFYLSFLEFFNFFFFAISTIILFKFFSLSSFSFLIVLFNLFFFYLLKEVLPPFIVRNPRNFFRVFFPILAKIKRAFLSKEKRGGGDAISFFEKFQTFVDIAKEYGFHIEDKKLKMVDSILELFERRVDKVRIDWSNVIYVNSSATLEDVKQKMIEENHSRIVYFESKNNKVVYGVIFIRNLLKFYDEENRKRNVDTIEGLIFPLSTIPATATLISVIEKMKELGEQMLLVVDGEAGIKGIVTFEDIFEEIFGDIKDEDQREKIKKVKVDKNRYILDATYEVDSFEEEIGEFPESIKTEDVITIGGLIVSYLGRIPESGEEVDISKYHFKILDSDYRKINRLELEILESDSNEG